MKGIIGIEKRHEIAASRDYFGDLVADPIIGVKHQ